ncbi:MAG: selenium-dependent xanthine dehydrogenase [Treponema sp.]|jgi:selenium-dependent xanthine dehydrogenase|nr:selenium-dependent xanthine dehydrogenase [Treponema sp.]
MDHGIPDAGTASFFVNGRAVQGRASQILLDFLRYELRLTAAKNGCGTGVCGACTVLADGKPLRSCLTPLSKIEGKHIVTVEGLTEREKEVYAFAFAEAGAVQCGFCTPGMALSAKALIDARTAQASPLSEAEIRKAIRSNICRCTGYKKIIEAIEIAAHLLRESGPVPVRQFSGNLGEPMHRLDAVAKTLGTGKYVDDLEFEGMLHASAVRSAHPKARVVKIDASAALAHPDCVAVLTAKNIPGNIKIGHLASVSDYDVMIAEGGIARFIGDALALVVCRRRESLEEVKAQVLVEHDVLEPLTDPQAAMSPNAPLIHDKENNILSHEHLVRGGDTSGVDEALAKSKYFVSRHYSLPFTEHAFMEPECAIAVPEGADGLSLYSAGQSVYDEQRECSRMLGIAPGKIHVKGQLVGGAFGGKEDMSVQHHACLAAWILKKPIKVLFSREESIRVHPKRHAMEIEITSGCDENGRLSAMKAAIVSDTGAYASLGGPVLQRACTHAAGPYNFHVIDIDGKAVYTNNIPAGAFRGFGVPQSCFAFESNLNLLAEMSGISPWEIRFRNAVRPGQVLPNGQIVGDDVELEACLLAVKDAYENAIAGGTHAGIACAFKNSGIGVGLPDIGRCILSVERGRIHIRTSAACIGQGFATIAVQIACETLELPPETFIAEAPDTQRTPNSGTTTASRQSLFSGEAVRQAALKLKAALNTAGDLSALEGDEFYGEYSGLTDPINSGKPNPVSHVAYSYAAVVAVLDNEGRVEKLSAAYDIGTVLNPKSAEGQVEGGLLMGMGYALTEDFPFEGGYPKAKYGTLGLLRADEAPSMEVIFVKPKDPGAKAYGAKGVGELAAIPVTPAIAGAYYSRDKIFRTKLPLENTFYRKAPV